MKQGPSSFGRSRVRLPRPRAGYAELDRFFDRHDAAELLEHGVMEVDPDREDLEQMRRQAQVSRRILSRGHKAK